jgi:hypothetical protein
VKLAATESGLDPDNLRRAIVNGFRLHSPKRAVGRIYHLTSRIKRRIDRNLAGQCTEAGKEREQILEFLWSHGVISTYKHGGKCMMINTVPGLGQCLRTTEIGEQILNSAKEWMLEYKRRHAISGG